MHPITTIIISDPESIAKLSGASGQIVFETVDGRHIRTVEPIRIATPAAIQCPFTEAELDEFCKERTGRPLDAILSDLKQRVQ